MMDWTAFLSIFSPEWIFIAIIIAAIITIVWHLIDSLLGLEFNDLIIFLIAFGVIIFLRIEGWYDVVEAVKSLFSMGVILWIQ